MRRALPYIVWIIVLEAIAGAIGWITSDDTRGWYQTLNQPSFTPPNWSFGVVWPILYAMIAVAGVMVWRAGKRLPGRTLSVYAVQLLVNFSWSLVFFQGRQIELAAVWILVLIALTVWNIVLFWKVRALAGALLLPYLAWLCFAAVLNISIWTLN